MHEIPEDPILPQIKELLTIFQNDLTEISFPDVSHKVLEEMVEAVQKTASEVEGANAKLLAAREALENSQNELLQKCIRGLAYAKVYAEDKNDLYDKLSKISLNKAIKSPKKNGSEKNRNEKSESVDLNQKAEKKSSKAIKQPETQNSTESAESIL